MSASNPIMNEVESEDFDEQPFYSNCVIESFKRKLGNWRNIVLIPLVKGWHFHMMWYDKTTRRIRHFTHRRLNGKFTTLLFKGTVDNVEHSALRQWCSRNGINPDNLIGMGEVK